MHLLEKILYGPYTHMHWQLATLLWCVTLTHNNSLGCNHKCILTETMRHDSDT